VYHPVAILDAMSTDRYSTRAAAASGCAADGGRFLEYHYRLFAAEPPEVAPGSPRATWSRWARRRG
jgi:protein-disulfide isomerase